LVISIGDNFLLRDNWMEGADTEEPAALAAGAIMAEDQALLVERSEVLDTVETGVVGPMERC
jgi:hypothetical protein